MSAILGGRKRGFILEIVEKTEKADSGGSSYPGWKRVVTKERAHLISPPPALWTSPDFCRGELNDPFLQLASLQELRESLQGLSTACTDISSDKVSNKTFKHGKKHTFHFHSFEYGSLWKINNTIKIVLPL